MSRTILLLVAATVILGVGSVVLSVTNDDAEAAKRPLLKTLWAVVNEDGTLDRSKGVTNSSRLAEGGYRITFNRDVSGCAYSATVDLSGLGEGRTGEIYVSRDDDSPTDPTTPRQVDVVTYNSSGTGSGDNQFDLIVHC